MPQLPGKYYLSVAAITANAGRYPISAKCEILGVPRSTYCSMRGHKEKPKRPDPLTPEVILAHEANRRAYGARKMKAALERRGFCASRRRIGRIMRENGLVGAYPKTKFKAHAGRPDEAQLPNMVAREFDGRAPRTCIVSDLTYVRVGSKWNYACLLVDLRNRETVGHAASERKDARPVKLAFATVASPRRASMRFIPTGAANSVASPSTASWGPSESKGPLKEGLPVRQRGRRVDGQDAEGRVRLQGEFLDAARAAGQAERPRPLVHPFQAALEARLRESG
nr:IS3 family transposase [Hugonella massiliensis]